MATFFGTADAYSHYLGAARPRGARGRRRLRAAAAGVGARARARTDADAEPIAAARRWTSSSPTSSTCRTCTSSPTRRCARCGRAARSSPARSRASAPPVERAAHVRPDPHVVPAFRRAVPARGCRQPSTSGSASTRGFSARSGDVQAEHESSSSERSTASGTGAAIASLAAPRKRVPDRLLGLRPARLGALVADPAPLPRRVVGARHVPAPRLGADRFSTGTSPTQANHANNMRLYEATGVGSLLVTDAKQNLAELFEPGREVVAYCDADDLVEQARHYLAHEDERRAIAAAGQARTLRDHTYAVRMRELAPMLEEHSCDRPTRRSSFAGKNVLITGGLGFIGSNLARELVEMGAQVVARRLAGRGVRRDCSTTSPGSRTACASTSPTSATSTACGILVRGQDFLFNLAGQTSHLDSMVDPYTDLEINCRSQLSILEACRHENPAAKIVFASTRQIYGRPQRPAGRRGPSDRAGRRERHQQDRRRVVPPAYGHVYGMRTTALRLTNTYGPRMRVRDARQTFLGIWLRLALEGGEILVYGDGSPDAATSRTSTTRSRRSCSPRPRGRGDRPRLQPRRRRSRLAARARRARDRRGRRRQRPARPVSRRPQGDRHRRLLRRLLARSSATSAGGRRSPCARASAARSTSTASTARTTGRRDERPVPRPARETARLRPRDSTTAIDRVLGERPASSSARRSSAFEHAFARVLRRAARDRRRVRAPTRSRSRCTPSGVEPGDEVITAPNTCVPTIVGIERAGAVPVLADVDAGRRYTLDPAGGAPHHTTHARDRPCPSLRPDGRPRRSAHARETPRLAAGRGLRAGARRGVRRPPRGLDRATRRRSASIRRRTSARSATAARS